ncbi:LysR family transcriptional regulator [Microbaculum sp. A6E488]|uniref:LysR family transcriptional regulator n=1 Tax=Microbaculum marinisediminis TaxID=2931392 RepID=A0AAW5QZR1_9HYPH|nr:LysR family transcriptional regulator [Microbaculum sp. A6E488]MCT8973541.1 LysR family transcriptional regulator [Microbaculum sp. A6E488]
MHPPQSLGIAQSCVNDRVKALEADLGSLPLARRAGGVRPTEAGRHFVERAAASVDQRDHAVNIAVGQQQGNVVACVSVAVLPWPAQSNWPEA